MWVVFLILIRVLRVVLLLERRLPRHIVQRPSFLRYRVELKVLFNVPVVAGGPPATAGLISILLQGIILTARQKLHRMHLRRRTHRLLKLNLVLWLSIHLMKYVMFLNVTVADGPVRRQVEIRLIYLLILQVL